MVCSIEDFGCKSNKILSTSVFYIDLYLFKNAFPNKFPSSLILKTTVYNAKKIEAFKLLLSLQVD